MKWRPGVVACIALALVASGVGRAQDGPGSSQPSGAVADDGQQIYEQVCQACHMADAKGGGGAGAVIPALANNPRLADKHFAIQRLVKGEGGMPWFTDMLTPAQMAAVINYVRGHFNAYADQVSAGEVEAAIQAGG